MTGRLCPRWAIGILLAACVFEQAATSSLVRGRALQQYWKMESSPPATTTPMRTSNFAHPASRTTRLFEEPIAVDRKPVYRMRREEPEEEQEQETAADEQEEETQEEVKQQEEEQEEEEQGAGEPPEDEDGDEDEAARPVPSPPVRHHGQLPHKAALPMKVPPPVAKKGPPTPAAKKGPTPPVIKKSAPCTKKDDCGGGQLCVWGECKCPILPVLSETSKRGCYLDLSVFKTKGAEDWCILPVSKLETEGEYNGYYIVDGAEDHPGMDLPNLADWSTCAVVGSSASLQRKAWGEEIDKHTAVIRFNDAPTVGFEKFVGTKTTMRVQNVEYCGFHEHRNELLVHYTIPKKGKCKKAIEMSPLFLEYEIGYFKQARANPKRPMGMPREDPSGGEAKLSGGFMGIAMAIHLCGSVDVYGFSESAAHYYDKDQTVGQAHLFQERHNWLYERGCLRQLSRGGMERVKVH